MDHFVSRTTSTPYHDEIISNLSTQSIVSSDDTSDIENLNYENSTTNDKIYAGINSQKIDHQYNIDESSILDSSFMSVGTNFTDGGLINNLKFAQKINFNNEYKLKYNIEEDSTVMVVKFYNHRLYVGTANGTIKIYTIDQKTKSLTCQYILEDQETKKNTVMSLNFSNSTLKSSGDYFKMDENYETTEPLLVVTYVNGLIKFWHISGKQCLSTIKVNCSQSLTSQISNNSKFLYTGGDSTIPNDDDPTRFLIKKYDIETKAHTQTFGPSLSSITDGHVRRIYAIKMHPRNENLFISAGWDDTVQFWDQRTNHSIRCIQGPHVCSESGLDISKDGNEILAASWRRHDNLQIFDWNTGSCLKTYRVSPKATPFNPYSCSFLDNRNVAVGSCQSNCLTVYDKMSIKESKFDVPISQITNLPGGVYSFDHVLTRMTSRHVDRLDNKSRLYAIASDNNVLLALQNKPVAPDMEDLSEEEN